MRSPLRRILLPALLTGACLHGRAAVSQDHVAFTTVPVDNTSSRFTLYTDPSTGRTVQVGGFSGLAPAFSTPLNRHFVTVTDRGPKVDVTDPAGNYKAFVAPEYSPSIVWIFLGPDGGRITRVQPLRGPGGKLLHGVPPPCNTDEEPIDDLSKGVIADRDPDGIDPEGIAMGPMGLMVICDEYKPSVALVASSGLVLLRLVPQGTLCGGEEVLTLDILPAVFKQRVSNRGIESVALSGDFHICAVLQRPLNNPQTPDKKANSEASQNVRVLDIDLARVLRGQGGAVRQLLYVTEAVKFKDVNKKRDIYLNDMAWYGPGIFLILERETSKTDDPAKMTGAVWAMDIAGATELSAFEDSSGLLLPEYQALVGGKKAIEALSTDDLATLGIIPVRKKVVLSFDALIQADPNLAKMEGLTLSDGKLLLSQDNDFNLLGGKVEGGVYPAKLDFYDPINEPRIMITDLPPVSFDPPAP